MSSPCTRPVIHRRRLLSERLLRWDRPICFGGTHRKSLLAYDSDGAGVNAALRAIGILRETGLRGRIINMSPAKDPDEFMKAYGAEAFQERIDKAENSFFFELRILERDYDLGDPDSKTRFYREIAKSCVTLKMRLSVRTMWSPWRRSIISAMRTCGNWLLLMRRRRDWSSR